MMTLVDLKKDLKLGVRLIERERFGKKVDGRGEVVKVQENGVYWQSEGGKKSKFLLVYPKDTLLEYDGKTIKIYLRGLRELTDKEKEILDNAPRNTEQDSAEYLFDSTWKSKSMRYDEEKNKVWDDNVRGELAEVYEIVV